MQNFTIENLAQSIYNNEQFSVYNTNFKGFDILTFKHNVSDELFFIGAQCADMLEYVNTSKAVNTHVSDKDKRKLDYDYCMKLLKLISNNINELDDSSRNSFKPTESVGLKENRDTDPNSLNSKENNEIYNFSKNGAIFISEKGLYTLIMKSNNPEALQFQNRVYDILKEIRQTGGYGLTKTNSDSTMNAMSQSMNAMSQTMNGMLTTLQNRLNINDIVNNIFTQRIGSYSHSIAKLPLLSDNNKSRNPAKKWTDQTSIYNMLGSLATYINSQYVKLCELSGKIRDINHAIQLIKTGDIIIERNMSNLEAKVDKTAANLESKVDKTAADLNYKVLTLQQQVDQSLVTNIDSLKLKIESLEEKLDDVI